MADRNWFSKALMAAVISLSVSAAAFTAQPQPTTPAAPSASAKPVVTILETGTNPQPLRYKFAADTKHHFSMVTNMAIEGQQDPLPALAQTMPTMIHDFETTIRSVDEQGSATMDTVITAIRVENTPGSQPGMDIMLRQQLNPLVGLQMTHTISARGELLNFSLADPSKLEGPMGEIIQQFTDTLESTTVFLPEEPLGRNAVWKIEQNTDSFGIKSKLISRNTITARQGDLVTIASDAAVTADPQTLNNPDLPPGITVALESLDSSIKTQFVLDLTKPCFTGTVNSTVTIRSTMTQNGQSIKMLQSVKSDIRVSEKAAPPPTPPTPATPE